ncbi:hypothetical protein QBC37DRAFT_14308 [Rhypophila decipiens]|uniref:NACHT domain-containing protein n=1 Tax=Rhypophila decipiens TaxID=261697 RepID=A0AAN6Y3X4_9PEZI|nr:hypothetical protein QBC37DRAFT_14308 [Rhypophila decipiens]
MAELAAFAVAGNVLQFLQAGAEFVTKAYQIYESKSDALADLVELRKTTIDLQRILHDLQTTPQVRSKDASKKPPQEFVSLAADCSKLTENLLQTLATAGVGDNGKRMGAVATAFRTTWHKSEIQRLKERIGGYRMQLAANLIISLREMAIQSTTQQADILFELRQLRKDLTGPNLEQPDQVLDSASTSKLAPGDTLVYLISESLHPEGRERQAELLRSAMKTQLHHFHDVGRFRPTRDGWLQVSEDREERLHADFMASLDYKERDHRELAISDPYQDTFRWIFPDRHRSELRDRKDPLFTQWLESTALPMYWITGKAGSGKSTLMKYIADFAGNGEGAQTCLEHLGKWSGDDAKLVTATFYFWASGATVQASRRALFQSLLMQILKRFPNLVVEIAPAVWETACLFESTISNPWPEEDLYKLLLSATKVLSRKGFKTCFFIDGLDEFDGDPTMLIQVCRKLLEIPNVKLCVSSRPWLVFEDAFKQAPNLLLQDLTYPDIKHFVVSSFSDNEGFRRLRLREPLYAESLMDQITEKSSGVFLWVQLVVKSLLAGLFHDDRISDLKRRLDLLPPDLEHLYVTILHDLDPFYYEHASQYFKLLLGSDEPPDALLISFADEEGADFAVQMSTGPITLSQQDVRIETLKRRLNSRCKGLLEVGPNHKVGFLHRSVRDFLDDQDMIKRMDEATKDYDCFLQLCSASLAMLKISGRGAGKAIVHKWVTQCLRNAAKVGQHKSKMIQIISCLERVIKETQSDQEIQTIYSLFPNIDRLSPWVDHMCGTSFLALAARFGVADYVRARAIEGCMAEDYCDNQDRDYGAIMRTKKASPGIKPRNLGAKLLGRLRRKAGGGSAAENKPVQDDSVQFAPSSGKCWPLLLDATCTDPPNTRIFHCLLERGADLNLVFHQNGATVWSEIAGAALIAGCMSGNYNWVQWVPILRLCMKYGAKVDRHLVDRVFLRLYRAPRGWMGKERAYVILDCVANELDGLALEYLRGEKEVANYEWEKRNFNKTPPESIEGEA